MFGVVRKAGLELKEEVGVEMQSFEKPICSSKRHEIDSKWYSFQLHSKSRVLNAVKAKWLADNRCNRCSKAFSWQH